MADNVANDLFTNTTTLPYISVCTKRHPDISLSYLTVSVILKTTINSFILQTINSLEKWQLILHFGIVEKFESQLLQTIYNNTPLTGPQLYP